MAQPPIHAPSEEAPTAGWRQRLHTIVFESDTRAGQTFDVALLLAIGVSVATVVLGSVESVATGWRRQLWVAEWAFTAVFTAEYALRLLSVRRPLRYATSFFGLVDLASILPTYFAVFYPSASSLLVVRTLRLVRVFRVFKLAHYLVEARTLSLALERSRQKIIVFLTAVMCAIVVIGTLMFVVEGPEHGFRNIPVSMYWAVVTVTTVGYGDLAPKTPLGQAIASCVMVLGYAVLAVPTGIVSVEIAEASRRTTNQACTSCGKQGHDVDAKHCKYCGGVVADR